MSVTELFEDPGEFTIPLRVDFPTRIRQTINDGFKNRRLDHIIILPQGGTSPTEFSAADFKAAARYAGPILKAKFNQPPFELWGRGMVSHLGLGSHGPIIADARQFTAATLSTVLDDYANGGIIPAGLTQGTITNTGSTFDIGFPIGTQSINAFRTTMKTFGAHFRVNADGTVDAGPKTSNEVFLVNEDGGAKLPVAVPRHWGPDPLRLSIEARNTKATYSQEQMIDSAIILEKAYDGSTTTAYSSSRSTSRYGINNVAINWVKAFPRPANDFDDPSNFLSEQLDAWDREHDIDIDLNQWEIVQGTMQVGGKIWAFDPIRGVYNTAYEINHLADTINPDLLRVSRGLWNITEGMGLYIWPGGASTGMSDVIDISAFAAWEQYV